MSQAERAIVGALIVDPSRIAEVAKALEPGHFGSRKYREAYEAMLDLVAKGKRVDAINLRYAGIDTADMALTDGTAVEDYVDIVKEDAFRRVVDTHVALLGEALDERRGKADILSLLGTLTSEVHQQSQDDSTFDQTRAVSTYRAIMEERKRSGVGQTYGIPKLDQYLQPAHAGDMVIVAARPSVGKTVMAEHIADHWAFEADKPVLFVSLEMSLGQLMDRAVSRWGGVPSASITRGLMTNDEEKRVELALEARSSVNLWYVDNAYATTATVRAAAAEVSLHAGGLSGIVVDYLQLLKDKGDNDNQRVGKISSYLKALARENSCPILVLSQLNRRSEYREDTTPKLSDLRDSGALEQDADVVIGLNRDKEDPENERWMDVVVLKNRQGPLSRVEVEFDGPHVRLVAEE